MVASKKQTVIEGTDQKFGHVSCICISCIDFGIVCSFCFWNQ